MTVHLRQQWAALVEGGRYSFDVFFATDKDTLKAGEVEAGVHRVTIEADSVDDARLLAEQMVASQGREPTRTEWIAHKEAAGQMLVPLVVGPGIFYHFTSTMHYPVIVSAGYLRPVESNISPFGSGGPDVVWLTDDPDAASHTKWADGVWKTSVRFTVKAPAARHWPEFARAHGIEEWWYDALAKSGGDPERWWVSPEAIPYQDWLVVEIP